MRQNHIEIIKYIIVGGLTTLVGYISFWLLVYPLSLPVNSSNFIAIHLAIGFAYFANRFFVFTAPSKEGISLISGFITFYLARSLATILEFVGVWFLADFVQLDAMVSKVGMSILIVILNYFTSKYWVFK